MDRGRQRLACTPDLQELDIEHVAGVPGGTRQLAAAFPVGHMAVWRVLREQLLYPYHSKRVRGLTPADNQHGRIANPLFVSSLLFTYQAYLVDMALQISTTRIGWQRRIHVIQSILDTTNSSELTIRLLMSYIYGAPILDVSRSHTTTQHSR